MITMKKAPDASGKKTTSAKQAEASRRNGRKSRGPVTRKGKERSRRNAMKHGFFAKVLPIEQLGYIVDKEEYLEHLDSYVREYEPESSLERDLIESLAMDTMRLRHIHAMELRLWSYNGLDRREIQRIHAERQYIRWNHPIDICERLNRILKDLIGRIKDGEPPNLRGEDLELVQENLQSYLGSLDSEVAKQAEQLDELREKASSGEFKERDRQEFEKQSKNLQFGKQLQREASYEALGCRQDEDIGPYLSGEKPIPEDKTMGWRKALHYIAEQKKTPLYRLEKFDLRERRMLDQELDILLDKKPRDFERLSRYETMVRKNMANTLKLLKQQRELCEG